MSEETESDASETERTTKTTEHTEKRQTHETSKSKDERDRFGEAFTVELHGEDAAPAGLSATAGAGYSLARLFEGNVTNQLYANNIQMATTAACVRMILGCQPRELGDLLDLYPPDRRD